MQLNGVHSLRMVDYLHEVIRYGTLFSLCIRITFKRGNLKNDPVHFVLSAAGDCKICVCRPILSSCKKIVCTAVKATGSLREQRSTKFVFDAAISSVCTAVQRSQLSKVLGKALRFHHTQKRNSN